MVPEELAAPLAGLHCSRPDVRLDVRWFSSVTSTMDVALDLVEQGARHGLVVGADEQSAGRGRRGHAWQSPPGAGLYFSIVVRPVVAAASAVSLLTLAAGVGVRRGIQSSTGFAPDLKWPNDMVAGRRKLAGILAEGVGIGTPDPVVIVGVGVNVQPGTYPPDVSARATSLEGELGRAVDRGVVLASLLLGLWDAFAALERDPNGILHEWRAASPWANGTRVEWDTKHGITAGIDDTGALLVRTTSGTERVIAGELRWTL